MAIPKEARADVLNGMLELIHEADDEVAIENLPGKTNNMNCESCQNFEYDCEFDHGCSVHSADWDDLLLTTDTDTVLDQIADNNCPLHTNRKGK